MTVSVGAWVASRHGAPQVRRCRGSLGWADEEVVAVDEDSRGASRAAGRRQGA